MINLRPYIDFNALKATLTIRAVLIHLGYPPHQYRSHEFRGGCPVHRSTSPRSRSLRCRGLEWFCGRCVRGGDVVRLWGLVHGLDDYQAALSLCDVMQIPVPILRV